MCSKRDEERKKLARLPVHDATKPKQTAAPKPKLSFEELMAQADKNSQQAPNLNTVAATRRQAPARLPKQLETKPVRTRDTSRSVKKVSKRSIVPEESLIKLNQQKRDLRSIEQIQMELRQEKSTEKK